MRLFIAIDFNELKNYFSELQKSLPTHSLSLTKSFHLTLKFLGEVQQDKVEDIIGILQKIRFEHFDINLDKLGIFPNENYIRVVWIGLNPENKVFAVQKQVDESLKNLFKEEKDFKAHITLARIQHLEDNNSFLEQLKKIRVENKKIEVRDFRLVKSTLTPQGPVYGDLEVFNFN